MRMANRIFADPDSDPEQDISRMVADGIDHSGLLLLIFPRPLILATAVLDFFPIEGARKTFHEIQGVYRYFGKADSISMVEGYHRHQYSPENLTVAFQFLDHFNRMPRKQALEGFEPLDEKLLLCTKSGQVSTEFPDAVPLTRLIRDMMKEKPSGTLRLSEIYRSDQYPGIVQWRIGEFTGRPAERSISWEALGSASGSQAELSRYLLHHSGELKLPVIHVKSSSAKSPRRAALLIRLTGKPGVKDWQSVTRLVDQGYDVVSFDFRGVGEQRMLYSTQTPEGVVKTSSEADYFDPLNSIMANYVYNSLLAGRPYLLQMIEDVEIVSRFASEKLGLQDITLVTETGDDAAVAWAAKECLPNLKMLAPGGEAKRFKWSETVEQQRELWPIQLLLPGGAYAN
jgi:hypothetical protein